MNLDMDNCERMSLIHAARVCGEGDIFKGVIIIKRIAERLEYAREKHPLFATDREKAAQVVMDECQEYATACALENAARQDDEALDVVATSIRFLGHEFED